jgi:hypothetical protein
MLVFNAPPIVTAGLPVSVTLDVETLSASIDTSFTGTVTFSSTDTSAVFPAPYTFTTANAGVYTFNVTFNTAGNQALFGTTPLEINPPGIATYGVQVQPSSAQSLALLTVMRVSTVPSKFLIVVSAKDAEGNVAAAAQGIAVLHGLPRKHVARLQNGLTSFLVRIRAAELHKLVVSSPWGRVRVVRPGGLGALEKGAGSEDGPR